MFLLYVHNKSNVYKRDVKNEISLEMDPHRETNRQQRMKTSNNNNDNITQRKRGRTSGSRIARNAVLELHFGGEEVSNSWLFPILLLSSSCRAQKTEVGEVGRYYCRNDHSFLEYLLEFENY